MLEVWPVKRRIQICIIEEFCQPCGKMSTLLSGSVMRSRQIDDADDCASVLRTIISNVQQFIYAKLTLALSCACIALSKSSISNRCMLTENSSSKHSSMLFVAPLLICSKIVLRLRGDDRPGRKRNKTKYFIIVSLFSSKWLCGIRKWKTNHHRTFKRNDMMKHVPFGQGNVFHGSRRISTADISVTTTCALPHPYSSTPPAPMALCFRTSCLVLPPRCPR